MGDGARGSLGEKDGRDWELRLAYKMRKDWFFKNNNKLKKIKDTVNHYS